MRNQPQRQTTTERFGSNNLRNCSVSPGRHGVNIVEIRPGRWLQVRHIPGKHQQGDDQKSDAGRSSVQSRDDTAQRHVSEGSITMDTENLGKFANTTSKSLHKNHQLSGNNDKTQEPNNSNSNSKGAKSHPPSYARSDSNKTNSIYTKASSQQRQKKTPQNSEHAQHDRMHCKRSSQTSLISLMEEPGTVLFFLHGVGGCADVWYHQLNYFQDAGFEMVIPDMLGHGFSRAPKLTAAYKFEELAKDVLSIFDRYAKKRNVLIGHSYGGSFCTMVAKERSRKVTKVVLISNGGPIPLSPDPCHLFCLPPCCLACIKPIINRTFARQAFHTKSKRSAAELKNAFDIPSYVLRATMQGQYWPEGGSDYHSSLSVGVLIIHGCQDELVSQEESETMQETIYASQLELVESAGHMVMVEQPHKVNELIHAFILKDMTISTALQQSHVTHHMTNPPDAAFLPSPLQRHKTVPNFSIT